MSRHCAVGSAYSVPCRLPSYVALWPSVVDVPRVIVGGSGLLDNGASLLVLWSAVDRAFNLCIIIV